MLWVSISGSQAARQFMDVDAGFRLPRLPDRGSSLHQFVTRSTQPGACLWLLHPDEARDQTAQSETLAAHQSP